MTDKLTNAGPGRVFFQPLRRPGKVRELAMGYSASVPLAREFRDAYRDLYSRLTACWFLGYNPQMLLTDQRSDEQKLDYVMQQAMKKRLDAFFDEIICGWVEDNKLPDSPIVGTASWNTQGPSHPRPEDLYRKGS